MKTVDTAIYDLLLTHECVIVPHFGGFLAKRKNAIIDFDKGAILPPSKSLQFNIQLQYNDGLLVNAYKQEHSISYEESLHEINQTVNHWKSLLSSGSTLNIHQVGSLWKDTEGNVQFEQDRNNNLLLSAYGLEVVHFIPQSLNELPKVASENVEHHQAWRYLAAAVIALPIVFYSYWIPNQTDAVTSGIITMEDLNPFSTKKIAQSSKTIKIVAKPPTKKAVPVHKPAEPIEAVAEVKLPLPIQETNPIPAPIVDQNVGVNNPPTIQMTQTFHCIVGCFVNPENARSFADNLTKQGFTVQTFIENGLQKVSIGNSFSKEGILEIQQKAQQLNIESWILEKTSYQ